jgi:hypothetical protein
MIKPAICLVWMLAISLAPIAAILGAVVNPGQP